MGSTSSKTATNVPHGSPTYPHYPVALDQQIEGRIGSSNAPIPGLSLAVISRKDGVIHYFNFGYQDLTTMKQTTSKTIYHLFSGTKLFTATAIMQLLDRTQLKLTDPIGKYLQPQYIQKYCNNIETKNILNQTLTISHLLTHSSGIADKMKQFMKIHFPHSGSISTLKALESYGPLNISKNKIGNNAKYCNFGYSLLGEIIGNANKKQLSYNDYMEYNIFKPLHMNISFGYGDTFDDDNIATGYIHRYSIFKPILKYYLFDKSMYSRFIKHTIGHNICGLSNFELDNKSIGGILCSVEELSKFVLFQLRKDDDNILKSKYIEMMQSHQHDGIVGIESKNGVGYGWKMGITEDNRTFINHEGGGPGFHSEIRIYPQQGLGIVICSNYATVNPVPMAQLMHVICEDIFEFYHPKSLQ